MKNTNQIFQGVCRCGATMIDMRETECLACKTAREAEEAQEHEAAMWDAFNDALLDEPDLDIDTFRARWEEKKKK